MQGRLSTSAGQARPRIICGPASHLPTSYLRPAGHNIGFARLLRPLVRGAVCVTIAEQEDRWRPRWPRSPAHLAGQGPPGSTWVHLATSAVLHLTTCQLHAIQWNLVSYSMHNQLLFLSLPITKTKKAWACPAAKILRAPAYIDNFLEVPISNDQYTVIVQNSSPKSYISHQSAVLSVSKDFALSYQFSCSAYNIVRQRIPDQQLVATWYSWAVHIWVWWGIRNCCIRY